MKTTSVTVEPTQLLLDPNNYRFHDLESYRRPINPNKYADPHVQGKTLQLIQSTPEFELQALKDSIASNGFVPLEQIVVEEYASEGGVRQYLVVEGNRRAAAIKTLLEEVKNGTLAIPDDKLDTLKKFQAVEIIGTDEQRAAFRQILMAIRHVSGVREWGPYQQAKLIAELYEKVHHQFSKVAQTIGLKARDVSRRYRAIKALGQMEKDDEYAEAASPKLYAYFDEALASPIVKEWLGWTDSTYKAENEENRRSFYELIIPREIDDVIYPPKLTDLRQVRKLKDIVNKPVAMSILLDPEKSLEDAVTAATTEGVEEVPETLERSIDQAHKALNKPGIDAWLNATENEKMLWAKLVTLIDRLKAII